jgi:dTMP kinase
MGRFLVIEGGDRIGKSTQMAGVIGALRARGLSVVETAFPDRTAPTAPLIEAVIAGTLAIVDDPAADPVGQAIAEQILFSINRREAAGALRAEIAARDVVVASRYTDSARAYAMARGVRRDRIDALHADLEGDLPRPDLVVVMDIDPDIAAARGRERVDAFDADLDLQRRVRAAYHELAATSAHIRLVDAAGTPAEVTARLIAAIDEHAIL